MTADEAKAKARAQIETMVRAHFAAQDRALVQAVRDNEIDLDLAAATSAFIQQGFDAALRDGIAHADRMIDEIARRSE
jgi:hypothetical protein